MSTPNPGDITSVRCLDDASYVLGSLSPSDRQAFEQHLAGCATCQASVARLAGLPGLLGSVCIADIESDPPALPEPVLPGLLTAAARQNRRRRRRWIGTIAAAAAALIAVVITLAVRPNVTLPSALPAPVTMQPLTQGPMSVSLQLSDRQWGTSVVVNCRYSGAHDPGFSYQLVAFDAAGKPQQLGWWMSVTGSASTIITASSIRLGDMSRLEVQGPGGEPLLSAVPRRA